MNASKRKRRYDFLIAHFKASTDQIQFMKKQQWAITYYCLLLYAAFLSIHRIADPTLSSNEECLLFLVSIPIAIAGCLFLLSFRKTIAEHRHIVEQIYKIYALECRRAGIKSNRPKKQDCLIFVTLIATVIVGPVVVAWLFFRNCITQ